MFGSNNKPLFGSSSANTGGFGSSGTFGSNTGGSTFGMGQQQPQGSLFGGGQATGGFGSSTTSTNLFGQPQQSGGGLFGSSTTTQPQSTGFGSQPSTSGFGGGGGGSLFSGNSTMGQSGSIFGANRFGSNTAATPFGSNTGNTLGTGMGTVVGTTVKFNPLLSNDTMIKNGVNQNINTRHQCITCMKEYENKSLEELRWEDYQANRKGPQSSSVFGSTGATSQPSGGGLFSSSTSTPSVSFNTNTGGSLFGQAKPAFGAPSTTTTTTSIFSGTSAFGSKPFGASAPAFGTQAQQPQAAAAPATGSLFGTSTSTPSAFGQQSTTTASQPSLFSSSTATNNNLAAKPLFGPSTAATSNAFGAVPTSSTSFSFNTGQPVTNTSVGGGSLFSNTQPSLFGNNSASVNATAAKPPMFNFPSSNTGLGATTNPLATSMTNTGGSLFNTGGLGTNTLGGNSGSLFGNTNTGTSLFGNNNTTNAFGASTLGQPNLLQLQPFQQNQIAASPTPAMSSNDHLMTRLLVLPYGTSPLFQNQVTSPGGSSSLKFTTDPKTLAQYKVNFSSNSSSSPSNKSVRVPNTNNRNTSLLFDDYEDVSQGEKKTAADIFVPRKSIKRLVIKPKEEPLSLDQPRSSSPSLALSGNVATSASVTPSQQQQPPPSAAAVSSSAFSPIEDKQNPLDATVMEFYRKPQSIQPSANNSSSLTPASSSLSSQTNLAAPSPFASSPDPQQTLAKSTFLSSPQPTMDGSGNYSQNYSFMASSDLEQSPAGGYRANYSDKQYKCGVICTRPSYFTIPSLEQLDTFVDEQNQTCIVPNFTVGRHDYGTIFWEGPLDVYGLNIDEIVHIRRKEVIVYPDDSDKAELGTGLNRPAQITLHKVWPVDRTSRELIKDVDRLEKMGYEEKIEAATIKFGGNFKEYRPETGSWVFCVRHFSKYGLLDDDDDDEEDDIEQQQAAAAAASGGPVHSTRLESSRPTAFQTVPSKSEGRRDFEFQRPMDFAQPSEDRFSESYGYNDQYNLQLGGSTFQSSGYANFYDDDEGEDEEDVDANAFSADKASLLDAEAPVMNSYFSSLRNALFEQQDDIPVSPTSKKSKKLLLIPDGYTKTEDDLDASLAAPVRSVPIKLNVVCKRELPLHMLSQSKQQDFPLNDIGSLKFTPLPKVRFFNGGSNFLFARGRQVQIYSIKLIDSLDSQTINRFEHQLNENSVISSGDPISSYIQSKATVANPFNDERLEKLIKALYCRLDIRPQSCYQLMRTNLVMDWLCEQNLKLPKPNQNYSLIVHYLAGNDLRSATETAVRSRQPKLAMLLNCGTMFDCINNIRQQLINWKNNQLDRFIAPELLRIYVLLSGEMTYRISSGQEIKVLEGLAWTQQLAIILLYSIDYSLKNFRDGLTCETDDVEYHLISNNSPLVAMSATRNDLEAWFLHQSLQSYGIIDVTVNSNVIHGLLAGQLLGATNNIRWACFVAAHINDDLLRDYTIRELLLLHISSLNHSDEQWLQTHLLLPKHFVAEAKAIYARSRFEHSELALQLLECGKWSESHETLIEHILPELVINEENEKLRFLIDRLKPYRELISGWYSSGAHIYDIYCQCVQDDILDERLMEEPFDFEQMRTSNCRQVLCKSEMARKINLIYHGMTGDKFILNTPVPSDYALSEIKSNFVTLLKGINRLDTRQQLSY